jgi:hypothetical protein
MPNEEFRYKALDTKGRSLRTIPFKELDLTVAWESFALRHDLTNNGIEKFVADYESTLAA